MHIYCSSYPSAGMPPASVVMADPKFQKHFRLPTKCVPSPDLLVEAVREQAGKNEFSIEIRHNMYWISLHGSVDIVSWL
ncbi:hypothetical protein IQ06DRAFT_136349 [Phaeosphaeriaceae sp. SRC1lsM3a]|nr:hypothetical protein IQ06DRAFT_136349 [Stagonospora sp. SRC1lsM3a]